MNAQHLDAGTRHALRRRFVLSNLSQPDTEVGLAAGQGWGLKGKPGRHTLLCLEGQVWVTQEGDIHDYLLDAGDAFVVTQAGLVLVRAMTPARLGCVDSTKSPCFHGRFSQTVFN